MRIVYFAHSVLNRGGDRMVLAHLAQLAERGHEVVIRSNEVVTGFGIHPAIRIEKPSLRSKLGTLVSAALERQQAECVIASIVSTAVLLALRNRGRVLHFAQDDNETAYSCALQRLLVRILYRICFSQFRLPTVAVSRELADCFAGRFAARCAVVPNGIDTSAFFPSPSPALLAKKEGKKAILLLSRSDWRKGYDIAKEVVAAVAKECAAPFEVWTVGEDLPWRLSAVSHRYLGNLGEKELREAMSSSDLLLYPSRSEGFGLMVLEAFACGCPVVTTDAIGFAVDGRNALASGAGDLAGLIERVARLLTDQPLADRLREEGLRLAAANTLSASTTRFAETVFNLFAKRQHAAG